MHSTLAQSHYFFDALCQMLISGDFPDGHPLLLCPLDPFSAGTNTTEKRAIATLNTLAGHRWAYALRCLHYGFVNSGRRVSALRAGLIYCAMYDSELRSLLRSHPDVFQMPALQLWDEHAPGAGSWTRYAQWIESEQQACQS
jgi:hypothetical protein